MADSKFDQATGQTVFEKIRDAMYERQRLSDREHTRQHHHAWLRPHDLRLLLADCEAAFDNE